MTYETERARMARLQVKRRAANPKAARFMRDVTDRLVRARLDAGLTQHDAAAYVGYAQASSFAAFEHHNRAWSLDVVLLLCELYNVPFSEIMGIAEYEQERDALIERLQMALDALKGV